MNTTALRCKFDSVVVRATYVSPALVVCIAPSRTAGSLEIGGLAAVEVSNNGLDFSESRVTFEYYTKCDRGWYCPGLTPQLCPNGTMCPLTDSVNFTRCAPGTFQPRAGQLSCVTCPVGFIW